MRPIRFSGMAQELQIPSNWDSANGHCESLPIGILAPNIRISYWKLSWKDYFSVLFGGKIRFTCISTFHPPVQLSVAKIKELKNLPASDDNNEI